MRTAPHILFLNQVSGPLFRELAEDLAAATGRCVLFTGHAQQARKGGHPSLEIEAGPNYARTSNAARLWSWAKYLALAFWRAWRVPAGCLLFVASNPPILPLVGYLMRRLRGQAYVVLVYDIYPDLLVRFGRLPAGHAIVWAWRRFNRAVWERAEIVFTVGDVMAANLEGMFDAGRTRPGRVVIIPNWADPEFVRPLPKGENPFAREHGQVGKLTILYSGNLGATHDIETVLGAANALLEDDRLHFMIVGDGSKWQFVEGTVRRQGLRNVTLLPFQPEAMLPYSLSTGDVAVVTLSRGAEGLSVPSKLYYSMAAGSALLVVSAGDSEARRVVEATRSGLCVAPGDVGGMVDAIRRFVTSPDVLEECRRRARTTLETRFSRSNTQRYLEVLAGHDLLPTGRG